MEADLPRFVTQLAAAIETSLARRHDTNPERVAGMTWNCVFKKIEVVWRQLIIA
jgi:hypothetical protein